MMLLMKNDRILHNIIYLAAAALIMISAASLGNHPGKESPYTKASSDEEIARDTKIHAMKISNDAYSDSQWAIHNPGRFTSYINNSNKELIATEDVDMNVTEAWEFMANEDIPRREVVVAVIDTGVDYSHPDLADHMWVNENEIPDDHIDNDNNGYVDDIYGWDFYNDDSTVCHYQYNGQLKINVALPEDNDDHGTHIAGIIAASVDNGIGIAGTASNIDVKIMVLKINGGEDGSGEVSSAVEAIRYATMMGADICNLSWGTNNNASVIKVAIKESDMLFVAAAGNSGTDNNEEPVYPASLDLDNLISVTYVNAYGKLSRLSNFGSETVDLAAPGDNIFSTVVGTYSSMSGSSMAAPQVCAVAALLYSYHNQLYPSDVKEILLSTYKPLSGLEGRIRYPGIPDAYQAVAAAGSLQPDTLPPEVSLKTVYLAGEIQIPVTATDDGGSGIRVIRWIFGDSSLSDFQRGTTGALVNDNLVTIEKAGTYTFYASDYAGNEIMVTYQVIGDTTPPKITTKYTVSGSYKSRTVTVWVNDRRGGVKRVKYMEGIREVSEFLPAGTGTEIGLKDNKGTFKVNKDGIYSIYAVDNFGNNSVKQIEVKTIKATGLHFNSTRKTLFTGEDYIIKLYVLPVDTSDYITYVSSEEEIATVSSKGRITALKPGTTAVTARSSSGIQAACEIIVVDRE